MAEGDRSEPRKTTKRRKPRLHPFIKWLRTTGIASGVFGLGALLIGDLFLPGVCCIYFSFALLALDVWLEPDFYDKPRWKLSAWAAILIAVVGFSWKIVFVRAPLNVFALMTNGEYEAGTVLSGISWKPEFTELDVDITNPTDRAYEDIDLVIKPNNSIAAIAQSTAFSGVTFEDADSVAVGLLDKNFDLGTSKAIPIVLLATDVGYRMRCLRLPARSTIKIVIALADVKWDPHPEPTVPLEKRVREPGYIMRIKDDCATYWFGHKEGNVYAPRPTSTDWVKIEGDYLVLHRTRHVSTKIRVNGDISRG